MSGVEKSAIVSATGLVADSAEYPSVRSAPCARSRYSTGLPRDRCTAIALSWPNTRSTSGTRAASTSMTRVRSVPMSPAMMPASVRTLPTPVTDRDAG